MMGQPGDKVSYFQKTKQNKTKTKTKQNKTKQKQRSKEKKTQEKKKPLWSVLSHFYELKGHIIRPGIGRSYFPGK